MAACSTTDEADVQHELTVLERSRNQSRYATAGRLLPVRGRLRSVRATVRVQGRTTDVSALDTVDRAAQSIDMT